MNAIHPSLRQESRKKIIPRQLANTDHLLLFAALSLLILGWLVMTSASIYNAERLYQNPFHFSIRQAIYIALGAMLGVCTFVIPIKEWSRLSTPIIVFGVLLLCLVLVPGIGSEINGSRRWFRLGFFNVQPSELVKLATILYMAAYLVRRQQQVRESVQGFLVPVGVLSVIGTLLLAEPDFGATVVIFATAMGMLFLVGVRLVYFLTFVTAIVVMMAILIVTASYRLARFVSFMDPWAERFGNGYQLVHSLIGIARGEWVGLGIGASIQKLHFLPEAHTDFVFAILAEEMGAVGALAVIGLFGLFLWRAFQIGQVAEDLGQPFSANLAYGLSLCIGLQALINIGVNTGMLPTKGITLPLMSYGGSSMLVSIVMVAFLIRIDWENRQLIKNGQMPIREKYR